MRLSWNEVRTRAAAFADEWRDAAYEKGETQSLYNDFFRIFGVRRRSVARYEEHVKKLNDDSGFIDLFWPGVLIVEQKSAGRDLESAYEQAGAYFDALPDHEKPRYILVSDFQHFALRDLDESKTDSFELKDLSAHVESFGFISLLHYGEKESTETHQLISTDGFYDSALHLLKMAREALIYISLAMHVEENSRKRSRGNNDEKPTPPLYPRQIDSIDRI